MVITYRKLKGSPLSIDELDQNFRELHERLEKLETQAGEGAFGGLKKISQEGQEIVFEDTQGGELGRFKAPVLRFNPTGEWQKGKEYQIYDLVAYDKKIFYCTKAHLSSSTYTDDSKNWVLFLTL
jgi:hypothetical protein